MTRLPNSFNPPEELDGLRILWVILIAMTLGDVCFLWNSYSYSVGDDVLAVLMTVSTMAGIVGLPMLAAWSLGAAIDHAGESRGSKMHLAICVVSIAATIGVIVFVTILRMGTVDVTEGGTDAVATNAASFGQGAQAQQTGRNVADAGGMLVMLMTGLLASTAVLSFSRRLIDCCMTLREPMIESYRRRMAPKRLAQIDAVLAGIEARGVEVQRADDERLRGAAVEMAAKTASEIVVDLEKEVSIASEDPASWQIAMSGEGDCMPAPEEGSDGEEGAIVGDKAGGTAEASDIRKADDRKAA